MNINMKKISKVLSIMLVAIMIFAMVCPVFAAKSDMPLPNSITGEGSNADVSKITSLGQSVVRILTTIGIVASVIVLIVLGVKYMMGSAEEKAEYKKTLIPYVVGAGLVFAASTIAQMVYTFMQNV